MTKPHCKDHFIAILQKCKKERNFAYTKLIYEQIREAGLDTDTTVGNHLVPALIESDNLWDAQEAFNNLVQPNSCSWTYLIQGYVKNGDFQHALYNFQKMQVVSVHPNEFTFLVLLKACTQLVSLKCGRAIHFEVVKYNFERELVICNSLLGMYVKCGSLVEACKVFDGIQVKDVVSWTTLIAGYVDHGLNRSALICFNQMQVENVDPNAMTYFYCLKACVNTQDIDEVCKIYMQVVKDGFERDPLPAGVLIEFYAKWVSIVDAHEVFNELPVKGTVLWTTLIAGYTNQGMYEEAMSCFQQMRTAGVPSDAVTFVYTLKACGNLGTLSKGLELHVDIVKEGYENKLILGNEGYHNQLILSSILTDMYAKCGLFLQARKVFSELPIRNVIAWTALMSGYAYQGDYELVLHYFGKMRQEDIEPNTTTFLMIFTVCNHTGLVNRGLCHFLAMVEEFDIAPTIKHHNSMVDLLGRAGQLDGAFSILNKMPLQPNVISWETVMGSCRKWGDIELARLAYESAERLDNYHSGVFVLMSNIYADIDV
ncbi:hypothetical protein GOP47_0005594 [Adiantum capillus-veneris]|uniref:Pentatricopeptide repeat-containing protein n=1 Tax=Adiantum capillus-veneris TaxID=13818 RepID=A0A9D4V5D1_ADICA|nr:hypothetical protein GOP47_0005594 [Adiantum capillus-veneris]